jgi:YhcH/YjgK/YiaL family protein
MKKKMLPVIIRPDREIIPDKSINGNEFNRLYLLNPEQWDKAFSFLRETDLAGLEKGRYALDGTDLFAIIDEYVTNDESGTRLEAHRKYADIQYIISGEEMMGIVHLGKTIETVSYVEEKDIVFLESTDEKLLHATPVTYFIFFPDDAHRPGIKVLVNAPAKKAVIKVRIG